MPSVAAASVRNDSSRVLKRLASTFGGTIGLGTPVQQTDAAGQLLWEDAAKTIPIYARDDGGNGDLGYPWAAMIAKDRALVVYYFNRADGPRHIAGTFLQVEKAHK